jgi:hypothetical protein
MRALLPSIAALFLVGASCAKPPPPPVVPGPPLPAEVEISVETMAHECDALQAALAVWKDCTNLEKDELAVVTFWSDQAKIDFAAGAKSTIEPNAQRALAVRCKKAATSVRAATERCHNGKRPRRD